jgi:hypothetical protein
MNPTETLFLIECRTGCTCCQGENHYRGLYATEDDAKRRINYYRTSPDKGGYWPLASQYSRRGNYSVHPATIETLPDGRKIINGSTVIDADEYQVIIVNPDGSVIDNESEVWSHKEW